MEQCQACAEGRAGALDQEAWRGVLRLHAACLHGSALGFIHRYDISAANVHDSHHFEPVLDPAHTIRTVWADSGDADAAREADLRHRGYRPAIQGQARKPSSEPDKRRNRRIAKDRVSGEHPFARLAQQGGSGRPNKAANACAALVWRWAKVVVGLKVAGHNLMRLAQLQDRALLPA